MELRRAKLRLLIAEHGGPGGPDAGKVSTSTTGEIPNVIGAVLKIVREEKLDQKLAPEATGQLVELILEHCRLAGRIDEEHIRKAVRFIASLL